MGPSPGWPSNEEDLPRRRSFSLAEASWDLIRGHPLGCIRVRNTGSISQENLLAMKLVTCLKVLGPPKVGKSRLASVIKPLLPLTCHKC
jgi:hypothetical protein